jgi:uncharacterized protein YggE
VALIFSCTACGPEASFAAAPSGQGGSETGRITVTGNAQVRVVPDEVVLTIGVETVDPIMNLAKDKNDAIVERVLGLVADYGVTEKAVQTDFVSIEPRYDTYYERKNFLGYFVRRNVSITLKDLSQFEGLLSALLDAGVTHVHGIDFRSTELRQHKDQARALAVQAAKEKAVAMGSELGQEIERPVLIREERSDWYAWYSSWWGASWGSGMSQNVVQNMGSGEPYIDGALAPGQIAINAEVTVTFELAD